MISAPVHRAVSGTLPKDWRWAKLGDVCDTASGGTPESGNRGYYGGSIPWIKSGELRDGLITCTEETITDAGLQSSSAKLLPKGTLLIAMYGATVGRLGITGIEAATNQAVCAIFPGTEVDRDFLFFYLLKARESLVDISFGGAQPNISQTVVQNLAVPLTSLHEQKRIAKILNEQMTAVGRALKAAEEQLNAIELYPFALVRESLKSARKQRMSLGDCLDEVRKGIGAKWSECPVLGAARQGLALAKDPVGKTPQRYKPVTCGTVFYNPMRILLGSIAMVDEPDTPGITSPDYVVIRGKDGILDSRWFYYWFRSPFGAHLIESLSRGAVRERILFNRLAEGMIDLPPIDVQKEASAKMRMVAGVKRSLDEQLATINRIPAALLRRAFNGEI